MPATATTRPRFSARLFDPQRLRALPAPSRSLDDVIAGAWRDLENRGRGACPVCAGTMRAGAGCTSCGSELN